AASADTSGSTASSTLDAYPPAGRSQSGSVRPVLDAREARRPGQHALVGQRLAAGCAPGVVLTPDRQRRVVVDHRHVTTAVMVHELAADYAHMVEVGADRPAANLLNT